MSSFPSKYDGFITISLHISLFEFHTSNFSTNWQGASKVEALRVTPDFKKVDGEVFRDLSNLRFLELDNVDIEGNTMDLFPDLVWLDWHGCPKKSSGCPEKSKLFAFDMKKLVILNLCSSPDKLTLEEWDQLMKVRLICACALFYVQMCPALYL